MPPSRAEMEKLKLGSEEYGSLAKLLRKVDFFAPLTVAQLENVLPYILLYQYASGETVFKQGSEGDAFYIIHEGQVAINVKTWFLGLTRQVAAMLPGDFFGEMALLSKGPRNATVSCVSAAKLFVLTAVDFQYILKENPAFAAEVAKIAARRKFSASH